MSMGAERLLMPVKVGDNGHNGSGRGESLTIWSANPEVILSKPLIIADIVRNRLGRDNFFVDLLDTNDRLNSRGKISEGPETISDVLAGITTSIRESFPPSLIDSELRGARKLMLAGCQDNPEEKKAVKKVFRSIRNRLNLQAKMDYLVDRGVSTEGLNQQKIAQVFSQTIKEDSRFVAKRVSLKLLDDKTIFRSSDCLILPPAKPSLTYPAWPKVSPTEVQIKPAIKPVPVSVSAGVEPPSNQKGITRNQFLRLAAALSTLATITATTSKQPSHQPAQISRTTGETSRPGQWFTQWSARKSASTAQIPHTSLFAPLTPYFNTVVQIARPAIVYLAEELNPVPAFTASFKAIGKAFEEAKQARLTKKLEQSAKVFQDYSSKDNPNMAIINDRNIKLTVGYDAAVELKKQLEAGKGTDTNNYQAIRIDDVILDRRNQKTAKRISQLIPPGAVVRHFIEFMPRTHQAENTLVSLQFNLNGSGNKRQPYGELHSVKIYRETTQVHGREVTVFNFMWDGSYTGVGSGGNGSKRKRGTRKR